MRTLFTVYYYLYSKDTKIISNFSLALGSSNASLGSVHDATPSHVLMKHSLSALQ